MYRYSNGQISLADFKQPVGMNLKESNRWVKKAQTIPWSEIEKRYAALFTNHKGNVVKPLRLAMVACIIQAEYGYSGKSRAYLFKKFQEELGVSIGKYITECRLREAKSLLRYTDKPLAEISSYLCFSSQSHFQNVFKKHFGCTPNDYRKDNCMFAR